MNVFNNGQLAHVWAQQSQDSGKNQNGSFFFTGSTIYSYGSHFPIAKFVADNTVLFTTESYGITTAKHCNDTRRSISHCNIFTVPNVNITINSDHRYTVETTKSNHKENVEHYKKSIAENVLKAAKARINKDFYNDQALRLCDELQAYNLYFKLRLKAYILPNKDELVLKAAKLAKAKKAAKAKAHAKIKRDNLDKIAQWLAGENVSVPYSIDCMLRIKGEEVQTSQRASFPLKHAYIALLMIERCVNNKESFVKNGKQIRLGHYSIDTIDINGNVKAGCHNIKYSAIKRIALDVKKEVLNNVNI